MRLGVIGWGAAAALTVGILSPASARPQYMMAFKQHYRTAQEKPNLNKLMCANLCHVGMPNQGKFSAYGDAFRQALGARMVQDRAKIVAALEEAAKKTAPGTNQTFAQLITADRSPAVIPTEVRSGPTPPPNAARSYQGTWKPLFNGRDMAGLTKVNQGNWVVENGILKYTGGGNGWLRTNDQYRNYALVMVWRYPNAGNNDSGLFLRAGTEGSPWPSGAVQLNMGPGENLGSIGGAQGTRARPDLIKRAGSGEWNTYQVTVFEGAASLAINGTQAWDVATGIPDREGYIGIQAEGAPIEIKELWIMPLQQTR